MKEYLVTAAQMKQYDKNTIDIHRIPSLLLMERAALVTVEAIQNVLKNQKELWWLPAAVIMVATDWLLGGCCYWQDIR